jgi:hypothetical protein
MASEEEPKSWRKMNSTLEAVDRTLAADIVEEPSDFSLVLGGPLYRLCRRAHLVGATLERMHREVLAITLWAWLPLLLLSIIDGHAVGKGVKIPFLHDIEANVRFLIALPVLLVAEVVVHRRISPLVRRFLDRRIIAPEDFSRFNTAVKSAQRGRDLLAVEGLLLLLVYTIGLWIWRGQIALGDSTWYARVEPGHLHLTLAGYWYVFVSIPFFQFILLRWYLRLGIWFRLLWRISRLNLRLCAAHPDRAGGIGFLGGSSFAFGPLLFAQGVLLSGVIASRVVYEGHNLLSFKTEAIAFVAFFILVILGPLVMFSPKLERARGKGSAKYGLLASRYVFAFEEKWMRDGSPQTSGLLGTPDIQSMADMGNMFSSVRRMRLVPFSSKDITFLAAVSAAPLVPLLLTMFSAAQVLKFLVKIVFR